MTLFDTIANATIMCGACDNPARTHGLNLDRTGFANICDRDPEDIGTASWLSQDATTISNGEFNDYVQYADGNHVSLSHDHSGTEALSGSALMMERRGTYTPGPTGLYEDEIDYTPVEVEQGKLDRWFDKTHEDYFQVRILEDNEETIHVKSWVCTSLEGEEPGEYRLAQTVTGTGHEWRTKTLLDSEETTEQRNAYVEGNPGFLSIKLLDEILTAKHHAKLLNIFRDGSNRLRIGSIVIEREFDGKIRGRCVNRYCAPLSKGETPRKGVPYPNPAKTPPIDLDTITREDMEKFVWACISHGNNHAADWFRTREQFYPLSRELSDPVVTDDEQYNFLKDHQRYCKDAGCECGQRMMELRPDRYYVALPA